MPKPTRFIGLDIHKHYMLAVGVNRDQEPVLGPHKVTWERFDAWMARHLKPTDAVVIEMTTNTWEVYDLLLPRVHSVAVVHPPHVKQIVSARVMTDKIAATSLARLHAAGVLPTIWIPGEDVREQRAMVAYRGKMSRLSTQAKNRLHAVIHRHHLHPPAGFALFDPDMRPWWEALKLSPPEKTRLTADLDMLAFAQKQKRLFETCLAETAAQDERVPLLLQLPGIAVLTAATILAAIGDIRRFPSAKKLVGYAGLGARVHDSGEKHSRGGITKQGRRDLRTAMVSAANHAAALGEHPFWKREFQRLEGRIGRPKAIIALARKLLVAVWHILTREAADRHADARSVACSLFKHAYAVGVRNLPVKLSAREYVRYELDRLGIGAELTEFRWGTKTILLPPSRLKR